jgi:hypothetical protein
MSRPFAALVESQINYRKLYFGEGVPESLSSYLGQRPLSPLGSSC